jgi:hypothetical protein
MKVLAELLSRSDSAGAIRVWLKSSAYTKRLLLGSEKADPWGSAATYLSYFVQAHGLLRPDVAVLEVGELMDAWCEREGGLMARMGVKRRPATALRKLLESAKAREVLSEIITAVLSHLRGQTPLILSMPSPRAWLLHANRMVGGSDDEVDADMVEDASMYVADLVRSVSNLPVAGLLMEEQFEDPGLTSEHVERYRSVLNVAAHYRWSPILRLHSDIPWNSDAFTGFDAVLAKTGDWGAHGSWGRDDSAAFAACTGVEPLGQGQFHFVEIDSQQRPEAVLEQLTRLRGVPQ